MKWKDYNRMSNKQKEEYNYRFKNHPVQINIHGLGFIMIIIYFLIMNMVIMSYFFIVNEEFIQYKDIVINALKSSSQLAIAGISAMLIIAVIYIGNVLIWFYKEKKWIKENNIRITHINRLVFVIKKMFLGAKDDI